MQRFGIVVSMCLVGCRATSAPPSETVQVVNPPAASATHQPRPEPRRAAGVVTVSRIATRGYTSSANVDADRYLPFKPEAVQECYAAALRASPSMAGWLIVNATVNGSGSVRSVKTVESEGLSESLISCAVANVRDVDAPYSMTLEVPVYMRFR